MQYLSSIVFGFYVPVRLLLMYADYVLLHHHLKTWRQDYNYTNIGYIPTRNSSQEKASTVS